MKTIAISILIILVTTCLFADWNEMQNLLASDGGDGERFGFSVSISGNYAVIGAYYDDDFGTAYMFTREGDIWTEQVKLSASDGTVGDRFGYSVSIIGNYVLIGAYKDDDNGEDSGSAYIFFRTGDTWTEQVKLTASDGSTDDKFGYSVSISENHALIGAYHDDDFGYNSGSAYIFTRTGDSWAELTKLISSDSNEQDNFGESVSIFEDYAAIGAGGNIYGMGSAYIFHNTNIGWIEQVRLTANDGHLYDKFGSSVAISEEYAVIGAEFDETQGSNIGSAYIFTRNDNWSEHIKLSASDGASGDRFGISISIEGDNVVIGSIGDDDFTGSAYIFSYNGDLWLEQTKLTASDGLSWDRFGNTVSMSGTYVIVGAYGDDNPEINAEVGSAYIFHNDGLGFEEQTIHNSSLTNHNLSNNPNPFNPSTTISFTTELTENTEIQIYNIKGQLVDTLPVNLSESEGNITWDASKYSSGVYFYKLNIADSPIKKMVLLK